MTDIARKLVMCKVVKDKCSSWLESQEGFPYSDDNSSKRSLDEELDDFDTDSEFSSASKCGTKRRRVGTYYKDEVVHLVCEWKDCSFENCTSGYTDVFQKHVSNHLQELEIKVTEDKGEVYICSWRSCFFETSIPDEISRHVNYHAYHTKLKCIGSNIRGRVKLPKCKRDTDWKNIFDLPPTLICRWEECLKIHNNYQMYLYHVASHLYETPRGHKIEEGVCCKWTGCKGKYPNVYKLKDHLRCHTKEKIVACPDCGATFASNTKFHVHCKRQIPIDVQGFQCSYCNKLYPTEGILRDHMRFHVFNYKCRMCDMTCESPASLAKHVRYRHISTRNFPCQLCSHAAKSQQDLDSHMTVHTNGPNFSCHFDGCRFMCKGAYTLERHIERVHNSEIRWYCCHECPIKYRKSYRLTKHLLQAHHLQLPSGHKRFQYMQDEDGCYRLQTVRYEGIEDENVTPVEETKIPDKRYKIKLNCDSELPHVEVLEDNEVAVESTEEIDPLLITEHDIPKSMPIISNILISIDEMDADGNIIKSDFVEAQETSELPLSEGPAIILT